MKNSIHIKKDTLGGICPAATHLENTSQSLRALEVSQQLFSPSEIWLLSFIIKVLTLLKCICSHFSWLCGSNPKAHSLADMSDHIDDDNYEVTSISPQYCTRIFLSQADSGLNVSIPILRKRNYFIDCLAKLKQSPESAPCMTEVLHGTSSNIFYCILRL